MSKAKASRVRTRGMLLAAVGIATAPGAATGTAIEPAGDRSLAPYFALPGSDGPAEALPLKETSAEVAIAGVISRVKVKQRFENTGKTPIEAVYVFPASTRAAVHGMRMKIGERTIEARIDRRAQARADYEAARQGGKRASLLEQERPNVFTMNVANIVPGDQITVELEYSELIVPEDGRYEFVYPTVVGPRYGGGADPARDRWIANPYLPSAEPAPYRFDIKAHIETGMAIKELSSPSHEVKVAWSGPARADVHLTGGGGAGNRDFVLRYRLAEDKIETGVLLWEGQSGERFFALLMEPPVRPRPAQIPPREYIFLVDVSGSMHGFPLDAAKGLMGKLLAGMRPADQFNVVLFAGGSHTMSPDGSLPASPANVAQAMALLDQQQRGSGGTELLRGLESSYRIPRRDRSVSRTVVVITDGYVGVEGQIYKLIRDRLGESNLFAFGIGSSVNRGLIEGMARAGLGEPFVVLRKESAAEEANRFRASIEQPVLTQISVSFHGFGAVEMVPDKLPDLMARRPLVLFGKYRGPASGRIDIAGMTGTGRFHQSVQVRPENVRPENAALRWLWARKRVALLDDERQMSGSQTADEAITSLGLEYRLLTAFTSFVAIDSQVANQGGQATTVKQPLPLPEGVSDLAIDTVAYKFAGGSGVVGGGLGDQVGRRQSIRGDQLRGLVGPAVTPLLPEMAAPVVPALAAPASPEARPARPPIQLVEVTGLGGLSDPQPLRARIEALLAGSACAQQGLVTLRLRLTVDRAGRVVAVQVLEGDRRQLRCFERPLLELLTPTRAQAHATGWIELRLGAQPRAAR
jgi:Ca-activated chloride channel homolog